MKGRTKWYPRHVHPVRNGTYEIIMRLCPGAYVRFMCEWDGVGFQTGGPMVMRWRGLTKAAYKESGVDRE